MPIFILIAVCAHSKQACVHFYSYSGAYQKSQQIYNLWGRLKIYFKSDLKNIDPLSDAMAARIILSKLEHYGSPLDLKIFDIYLAILEQTTGGKYEVRVPGFYIDLQMGLRTKSHFFQERHWDWNIFEDYFLNTPLTISLTKELDLSYLKHVLATAKSFDTPVSLRQVLQKANHLWALKELNSFSDLNLAYVKMIKNKSYDEFFSEITNKVYSWVRGGKSPEERKWRHEQVQFSMDAFRSSNSLFDLYLFNTYFDLIQNYPKSMASIDYNKIPTWLQLTDPRVFTTSLPYLSLHYLTDFLFQNSHDNRTKIYLLSIFHEMKSLEQPNEKDNSTFYLNFIKARETVDTRWSQISSPSIYQADLHIFSERWHPQEETSEALDHLLVSWNPRLGRLQTSILESHPRRLNENATVASHPMLQNYIKTYFNNFKKHKTYKETEIDHDEKKELAALLKNSTYLVFTKPDSDQLLTMVRIFDATNSKSFIEEEFPNVQLPGRENGDSLFELGRLFATNEVEINSLGIIMARVAEYFHMTKAKGYVYFDANQAAMKYYHKQGASILLTPDQLNISAGGTPLWVMRFSVEEIIKTFYKSSYSTVQIKKIK